VVALDGGGSPPTAAFCGAVRAWLADVPTLDLPLAEAAELLDDADRLDGSAPLVEQLERLAADGTDARLALGARALLALWRLLGDAPS
jgi:hypothetical protein